MLWIIAVILAVLWLLGFVVVHITSPLLHILLIIAVIVIVANLINGRRAV